MVSSKWFAWHLLESSSQAEALWAELVNRSGRIADKISDIALIHGSIRLKSMTLRTKAGKIAMELS